MNKFLILLVLSFISVSESWSQKSGYVDMEFITSKMPEYQQAQTEMKKFSEKWAKEIDDKFAEINKMQRTYMAEEVLLTDELKRKRQTEIKEKELEAREYNSKIFGMDGLLFQKKKELMKPVLERVQRAVTKVCTQRRLDLLFDKSSDIGLLFTNPMLDYSDYVMDELGLNEKQSKEATPATEPSKKPKGAVTTVEEPVKETPKGKKNTTIKPK
jgi:outer membrane protein